MSGGWRGVWGYVPKIQRQRVLPWHLIQPKTLPYVLPDWWNYTTQWNVGDLHPVHCCILSHGDVDVGGGAWRHDIWLIRIIGEFKDIAFPGMNHTHAKVAVWFWFLRISTRTHTHTGRNRTYMPTTHCLPSCGVDVQAENQTAGQLPGKPLRVKCFQTAGFCFITTNVYF